MRCTHILLFSDKPERFLTKYPPAQPISPHYQWYTTDPQEGTSLLTYPHSPSPSLPLRLLNSHTHTSSHQNKATVSLWTTFFIKTSSHACAWN